MKPMNFWNKKENCLNEAKKYKTAYALQRSNYSCYFTCLKNGWFEEFGIKNKYKYGKNR